MKIIRFDAANESASRLSPKSFFTENAILMADSCLRPHRRPLFADPTGMWLCEIRMAIKVSHLGKAIAREFAPRYYAEYTLLNYMWREVDPEAAYTPNFMLDDAVIQGVWLPLPAAGATVDAEVCNNDQLLIKKELALPLDFVDRALEALSQNATLKTGDILILPLPLVRYIPKAESHITVDADGQRILDFKIK